MLILIAKYALFMCIILNIGNNRNCENDLNKASNSHEIYWKAACAAKCLLLEKDKNFEKCSDYCIHSKEPYKDDTIALKKINENHDLSLICRDDRSLTLKVILPTQRFFKSPDVVRSNSLHQLPHHQQSRYSSPQSNATVNSIQEVYVINVSLTRDAEEVSVYLSNEHFITIENLRQNTTYNVSVTVVYSSDEYSIIARGRQFTTLRRGYKPNDILEIGLLQFAADEADEMRVSALISWTPSHDKTCHYDLICYSPEREDMEVTPIEIRNPQSLYTYALDNLTFATVYNVGIRAKNTNDSSKESGLAWKKIKTPSCIEWHHNNFNICAPLKPEELFVEEHFLAANEFSLNVSWQHPKFEPDYYTLKILDLDQFNGFNMKSHILNVTRDQHWVFIPTLTLKGMFYEAHLTAFTPGGSSTTAIRLPNKIRIQVSGNLDPNSQTAIMVKNMLLPIADTNQVLKLIIAILAPIFCIAILSLTIFIICHRRAKLKRYQERCKYFEELEKKAPIDPKSTFDFPTKTLSVPPSQDDLNQFQLDLEEKLFFSDDMEISRSDVTLFEVLGEGAFGLVRRGIFRESKRNPEEAREVAVKMLKDQPSVDDVRAFRREIEVMKSVGSHPNIVGIIGHCTKKYNEMLLLTEYCSFGNLLQFLRNEWKYLHELSFRGVVDPSTLTIDIPPHPLSAKRQRNLSDSVFNFDSTIVEKIKMKYKNINSTSSNGSTGYVPTPVVGGDGAPPAQPPGNEGHLQSEIPPANSQQEQQKQQQLAKFNKSYGYDEICTSACKCQVDILPNDSEPALDRSKTDEELRGGQIKISNKCECRLRRSKLLSVDNAGYYKNLVTPTGDDKLLAEKGLFAAKREPLKSADLLDIAKQVALGMEFLSKNKVVHRDLAARNVLVSSDRTVKIADFGLSRDVYQENVYKKTGNGKLPIKWLALESMTHQVYTSQSDVWSYGILLYEIATLGGIPYPSIPTNRLLHLLKTGYRMEKPKNCEQELYKLMLSCWHFNPADRPNFTKIIKILDCLLTDSPQFQIAEPPPPKLKNSPDSATPTSDDSYLKPL